MNRCRYCQREIADSASVCPYPDCGRLLAVPGGLVGNIPSAPPPPGMWAPPSAGPLAGTPPAPPMSSGTPADKPPVAPGGEKPPVATGQEYSSIAPPPPPGTLGTPAWPPGLTGLAPPAGGQSAGVPLAPPVPSGARAEKPPVAPGRVGEQVSAAPPPPPGLSPPRRLGSGATAGAAVDPAPAAAAQRAAEAGSRRPASQLVVGLRHGGRVVGRAGLLGRLSSQRDLPLRRAGPQARNWARPDRRRPVVAGLLPGEPRGSRLPPHGRGPGDGVVGSRGLGDDGQEPDVPVARERGEVGRPDPRDVPSRTVVGHAGVDRARPPEERRPRRRPVERPDRQRLG